MAMLAKSAYPAPMGSAGYNVSYQHSPTFRVPILTSSTSQGVFTSPTESEFSETYDSENAIRYISALAAKSDTLTNAVRGWDELKVGEWLKSINCAQYIELFRSM